MKETILIVDDEKHICSVLAAYLREQGYTVFEANDLATARLHLKKGLLPDLVVLDVMLGDGNGIVLVREMRASTQANEIPVIMMSAHRTKSHDRVMGLELGADDYLTKPFDLRELHLRIEKILKSSRRKLAEEKKEEPRAEKKSEEADEITSLLKGVFEKKTHSASTPILKPKIEARPKKQAVHVPRRPIHLGNLFLSLLLEPTSFLQSSPPVYISWASLGCLFLAGAMRGLQEGIAERSIAIGFVSILTYGLAIATFAALLAWSLQWYFGLRQKSVSFKPLFAAIGLGCAPLVLSGFLGALYTTFTSGRAGEFTAGLLLILPSQASSKFIGPLLRRFDLYELWAVGLVALALHHILQGSRKKIIQWTYGVWLALVLLLVLVKGFFL